jgi:TIR domain/NB-ARC domain
MKVFLSHSTKDKEFVQTLAQQLQAVRIEPWLCEVDVLFGDDFVEQIKRGLQQADVALLVWSPDAAKSAWTGKEWRSVLAREVEESRTRLGLFLLGDAAIPELLRTKHRIDARTDREQAIQETVAWLVRQRDMRQYESTGAPRFIVDYEPTDFVGRTAYLEQLHEALVKDRGKFLLWGGPGCGKSTVALKFAWRARGAFDAVVFQHCGQRPVEEIANELAESLGLDLGEVPPERQIMKIKEWVCQRRTLLVLDDIWNPDIRALIPGPPLSVASLSLLCTSRQRTFPWIKRRGLWRSRCLPKKKRSPCFESG